MIKHLYHVIQSTDLTQFQMSVCDHLDKGWELIGGLNVTQYFDNSNSKFNMPGHMVNTYSQAMYGWIEIEDVIPPTEQGDQNA